MEQSEGAGPAAGNRVSGVVPAAEGAGPGFRGGGTLRSGGVAEGTGPVIGTAGGMPGSRGRERPRGGDAAAEVTPCGRAPLPARGGR